MFPPWVPVWPSHTMKHKLPIKMIILLLVLKVKSNDVEKYAVVWHIIYIIATKHCTKAVRKIKLHSEENPVPDLQREKRSCIPDMRPDGPYHNQFWVYPPLLSTSFPQIYTHAMKLHGASVSENTDPSRGLTERWSSSCYSCTGRNETQTAGFTVIS